MNFDDVEIEICRNAETLGFDTDGTRYTDRDALYMFAPIGRLEAIGLLHTQIIDAQGQRGLHHGWKGAHFTHRGSGWGTFCNLTTEQEQAIEEAVGAAHQQVIDAIEQSRKESE